MILGIGIDSIHINRFNHWKTFTHAQLLRLFSTHEITYCTINSNKMAERLAIRFAAREAFYKALHHMPLRQQIPFLTLCKQIIITHNEWRAPIIEYNAIWLNKYVEFPPDNIKIDLSMTHTADTGTAIVILSTIKDY